MTRRWERNIEVYKSLMAEIPSRVNNIKIAAQGKMEVNETAAEEFCYLQIRIICELVALAALVAHGDMQSAQSLRREWSANKIMKRLEQMNSDCFPIPCFQDSGEYDIKFRSGIIDKDEFLKIYGESGDKLHRGSINKIISQKKAINFDLVLNNAGKIMDLISMHLIFLNNQKTAIIFNMNDDGKMKVYLAEKKITDEISKEKDLY